MKPVLILNQDFRAVSVCSVQRAFVLVYLNKAEPLQHYDGLSLNSVTSSFPYPAVIRLNKYVHFTSKGLSLSRQNILKRDGNRCLYCGSNRELTLDHVLPKSRGGKTEWANLATACKKCNSKKGDHTPEEAGMKLRHKPYKPSFITFLRNYSEGSAKLWDPYIFSG